MKVALISHEGGGISTVALGLGRGLATKKIDTTIFTGSRLYANQAKKVSDHLEIVYLPIRNLPPRHVWFQALNFNKLLDRLKNYDLIHGVSPNASFALTFFKKRLAKPFVASIHDDPRNKLKGFVNQPLSSWTSRDFGLNLLEFPLYDFSTIRVLSCSDHLIFCSYSILQQIKTNYKNLNSGKISVIQNGIDIDEIDNLEDQSSDKDDATTIIYAGRLYWFKGIMFLLEAFNQIRKSNHRVNLRIFGAGPLKQEIEKFISNHDLSDRVSYQGYVQSHRKVLSEIKNSHIVVFPSLSEAQSMFMLEAMACKKPLLAFDLPFAREAITHMETGLLAKAGDVEDLARKIQLLVNDKHLRLKLGQAAYAHVKKKHNWGIQTEAYLKVYEQVIDRTQQKLN